MTDAEAAKVLDRVMESLQRRVTQRAAQFNMTRATSPEHLERGARYDEARLALNAALAIERKARRRKEPRS